MRDDQDHDHDQDQVDVVGAEIKIMMINSVKCFSV